MNRIRLYLHRLLRRPAVTGPYRIYTRPIPGGVMLDIEHYLVAVLETLADNPDLLELLDQMARDRELARGRDRWEPEELFVEKLTLALGYELPVYGREVAALANELRACSAVSAWLPAQRREGGAAA